MEENLQKLLEVDNLWNGWIISSSIFAEKMARSRVVRADNRAVSTRDGSDGQQQLPWQLWSWGTGGSYSLSTGGTETLQVTTLIARTLGSWSQHGVHLGPPGPRAPIHIIKMTFYQYRKSHCGDKTILRPSYLHNGISYTGKTTSLFWIRAQVSPMLAPWTLLSGYSASIFLFTWGQFWPLHPR